MHAGMASGAADYAAMPAGAPGLRPVTLQKRGYLSKVSPGAEQSVRTLDLGALGSSKLLRPPGGPWRRSFAAALRQSACHASYECSMLRAPVIAIESWAAHCIYVRAAPCTTLCRSLGLAVHRLLDALAQCFGHLLLAGSLSSYQNCMWSAVSAHSIPCAGLNVAHPYPAPRTSSGGHSWRRCRARTWLF
jgi:hypothetical protein